MLSQITNLLDPFFLFLFVEVIALLVLLVVWLDIGFSLIYVALYGHVTPEVASLLFPPVDEVKEALQESVIAGQTPKEGVTGEQWYDIVYGAEPHTAASDQPLDTSERH
jgi:hypothetical protein